MELQKILAVIPARGGSKGIPRKNVRLLDGQPLISYTIANAKRCGLITDLVVTTDDEEIISIAQLHDVDYVVRDAKMAGDQVTLDPVVYDAVVRMEKQKHIRYDIVITLQPTSPLLSSQTLSKAINAFLKDQSDSYISAVNRPHLIWTKAGNEYVPYYKKRLNRQQLPPLYFETGAFFITKRVCVKPDSRTGRCISIFEVPDQEAADIDSPLDWIACENMLKKKKIVLRVDGHKQLGMGHIYRCLTLAYNLTGHELMFVTNKWCPDGIEKIKSSFMPCTLIGNDEDFFEFLKEWHADIVVNDCLDTQGEYISKLKELANRVITFEDLGEGRKFADAVINALYHEENPLPTWYGGEKYICLRDEFLINKPKEFSNEVKDVIVMFGGTDPCNLTKRIYDLALKLHTEYPGIRFTFLVGCGYDCAKNGLKTLENKNIRVLANVKRVSDYMKKSDLAFTSQGRTVFELASLGVPSIVLAQNEREQLHTFAQMQNGFVNLGLGKDITEETIKSTFHWLVKTTQIRREMRALMLRHDLKKGIGRVIDLIVKEQS